MFFDHKLQTKDLISAVDISAGLTWTDMHFVAAPPQISRCSPQVAILAVDNYICFGTVR